MQLVLWECVRCTRPPIDYAHRVRLGISLVLCCLALSGIVPVDADVGVCSGHLLFMVNGKPQQLQCRLRCFSAS